MSSRKSRRRKQRTSAAGSRNRAPSDEPRSRQRPKHQVEPQQPQRVQPEAVERPEPVLQHEDPVSPRPRAEEDHSRSPEISEERGARLRTESVREESAPSDESHRRQRPKHQVEQQPQRVQAETVGRPEPVLQHGYVDSYRLDGNRFRRAEEDHSPEPEISEERGARLRSESVRKENAPSDEPRSRQRPKHQLAQQPQHVQAETVERPEPAASGSDSNASARYTFSRSDGDPQQSERLISRQTHDRHRYEFHDKPSRNEPRDRSTSTISERERFSEDQTVRDGERKIADAKSFQRQQIKRQYASAMAGKETDIKGIDHAVKPNTQGPAASDLHSGYRTVASLGAMGYASFSRVNDVIDTQFDESDSDQNKKQPSSRSFHTRSVRHTSAVSSSDSKSGASRRDAGEVKSEYASNPRSRQQQKQYIKQQYNAARTGQQTTLSGAGKAVETTVETERKAAAAAGAAKAAAVSEPHVGLIATLVVIFIALIALIVTACSGTTSTGGAVLMSSYLAEDADMLGAEAQYCQMEAELQSYLDNYESTHDYDEYNFDLDEIEHDPYVLISILQALHPGVWTLSEVQGTLQSLFDQQYVLTETVTTEVRDYLPPEDPDNPADPDDDPPEPEHRTYRICTVKLENRNLSHLPVMIMTDEQFELYGIYMQTLGNRPDLFPGAGSQNRDYLDYGIPPEALEDEVFAAMMAEATKYLGYPYVWGGSNPSTSFDCSGFVSWVINHSGWNVGRLTAQGLCNICTPVSTANAKPGDLVFFKGTYATSEVSHVGIYVGNGMMIHCGDPIGFANLNDPYWQAHLYCYGRLP